MTAINTVLQPNGSRAFPEPAAHIISDGAAYRASGELMAVTSKVATLPHFPAAIAVRGPVMALACFTADLSTRFDSFDALIDGVEEVMPDITPRYSPLWASYGLPRVELTFVGWSPRHSQFVAHLMITAALTAVEIASLDQMPDGSRVKAEAGAREPFKLYELADDVTAGPLPDMELCRRLGMKATCADDFDPEADGLAVLQAQRQLKCSLIPGLPECHHIGGFAQRTTITRHGVEQKIFHRWPDRIGELINPGPLPTPQAATATANVTPIMSRQQRRAAARAERRAG